MNEFFLLDYNETTSAYEFSVPAFVAVLVYAGVGALVAGFTPLLNVGPFERQNLTEAIESAL